MARATPGRLALLLALGALSTGCDPQRPADTATAAPKAATESPTPKTPAAQAASPAPAKTPVVGGALRLILVGRGDYLVQTGDGPAAAAAREGADGVVRLTFRAPDDWRALHVVRIDQRGAAREAPRVAGRFTVPYYSFLPWADERSLRLAPSADPRCGTDADAGPETDSEASLTEIRLRALAYWSARVEACRRRDENGWDYLHALEKALGTEKLLVQIDPERHAVSEDLRSQASRALRASQLCTRTAPSVVCKNLRLEFEETRYVDYRLHEPLTTLRWSDRFPTLSDRELTGALQAWRAAEEAYLGCRRDPHSSCGQADFAALRLAFCDAATKRELLGHKELCRPVQPVALAPGPAAPAAAAPAPPQDEEAAAPLPPGQD
jgi:hypothetical protein